MLECFEHEVWTMRNRIAAAAFACGVIYTGAAVAQVVTPNPTQGTVATGDPVSLFRVTVVGRTTPAINYRPRHGDTRVDFAGTALMPAAKGKATISGEKGYIKVDARFDKLAKPQQFGPEYLTYVLWAITPEGRATNLGEVQRDDEDARVQVTTELQAFGLILTAEPYFAVTQPSDAVVMENVVRDSTDGKVETIQAEVRTAEARLVFDEPGRLAPQVKSLEPGAPLDLAQARNAVELARLAGADRYATDTFTKARGLLDSAEQAREKHRGGNAVMQPARQAVQTAEDARLVGLQRQEEAYAAEARRVAAAREQEALSRAQAEEARRRQAELDAQSAAAARATAERQTQSALAEQEAALRARADADRARADAEAARTQADAARRDAEAQAEQARQRAAQSEQEKAQLKDQLRQQLNVILETRETARGLIVNLSDVLFDTARSDLKPGAREKLARVSGILASHPGLRIEVEGNTDSVGTDEYNQRLSERPRRFGAQLPGEPEHPASHGDLGRPGREESSREQ
jgi:outer membrane protein OmpA-like peptidoglycan-associated protein